MLPAPLRRGQPVAACAWPCRPRGFHRQQVGGGSTAGKSNKAARDSLAGRGARSAWCLIMRNGLASGWRSATAADWDPLQGHRRGGLP
jgi:hypothetical protein